MLPLPIQEYPAQLDLAVNVLQARHHLYDLVGRGEFEFYTVQTVDRLIEK